MLVIAAFFCLYSRVSEYIGSGIMPGRPIILLRSGSVRGRCHRNSTGMARHRADHPRDDILVPAPVGLHQAFCGPHSGSDSLSPARRHMPATFNGGHFPGHDVDRDRVLVRLISESPESKMAGPVIRTGHLPGGREMPPVLSRLRPKARQSCFWWHSARAATLPQSQCSSLFRATPQRESSPSPPHRSARSAD